MFEVACKRGLPASHYKVRAVTLTEGRVSVTFKEWICGNI